VLVASALLWPGCAQNVVAPDEVVTSESVSGTLEPFGTVVYPFTVPEDGVVTITVMALVRRPPPLPWEEPPGTDGPPAAEDGPPGGVPGHTDEPPGAVDLPVPPTVVVGLAIGTWDGATCTPLAERTDATTFTVIAGTALAGEFCMWIFDPGGVTDPVEYEIQVDHP
jgi:hypothetical protein